MTPGGPRVILQGESNGQNATSAGMDLISVDVFGTCCLKQAQILTEERKLTFPASFPRNCIMVRELHNVTACTNMNWRGEKP